MTARRRIAVVTGTRAEFGLLRPVIDAIDAHGDLDLLVVAVGAHLLGIEPTIDEVAARYAVAATIEMQSSDGSDPPDRFADAEALGRGVSGIARWLREARPDVVLVLGDRIEAFAAAAAASVAGVVVAHMHGGDRAEGIADEAMRHAITKLAHIHLPATEQSAERIIAMGEPADRVHVVGSPAIDGLADIPPLDETVFTNLGLPEIVVLHHPVGRDPAVEREDMTSLLDAAQRGGRVLALMPNHDHGRAGIMQAIIASGVETADHLPRDLFIGLLKRAKALVGNSSAGLIEAAALGVWAINIGDRQAGRERAGNVIDIDAPADKAIGDAFETIEQRPAPTEHPYGDGRAGPDAADLLATVELGPAATRKRNTF